MSVDVGLTTGWPPGAGDLPVVADPNYCVEMTALPLELSPSAYRFSAVDRRGLTWAEGGIKEVNELLARAHYLGPIAGGRLILAGYDAYGDTVAAQVWRTPTSRRLPSDGSWLELSRWCLTPAAGDNAGSRQHRQAVRMVRLMFPEVTTLVSYSDPDVGHTGALYRSCNWQWAPTWLRLRPPPTGNGNWGKEARQAPKDRWVFAVREDAHRAELLTVNDPGAIRYFLANSTLTERAWAARSLAPDLVTAVARATEMAS